MNVHNPNVALRAALYLRVSTSRQAEHDVSIPDQRRQGEAWCEAIHEHREAVYMSVR